MHFCSQKLFILARYKGKVYNALTIFGRATQLGFIIALKILNIFLKRRYPERILIQFIEIQQKLYPIKKVASTLRPSSNIKIKCPNTGDMGDLLCQGVTICNESRSINSVGGREPGQL